MIQLEEWKRQLEQSEEQGLFFDRHTVKEMIEKIESLQNQLDAKITLINNGWEEERYDLQEKVIRYEEAIESRQICDKCNSEIRKILNKC